MDTRTVLVVAGASAIAFIASKLLMRGDTRIEDRRRAAVGISQWAAANGLPMISQALGEYSLGNYSGLLFQLGNIREVLANPDQSRAVIDNFLQVQLKKKLDNADEQKLLLEFVGKYLDSTITVTPVAAAATENK